MTNAILRGKPDAGNPHVRFDEGEVASAKPRRGSLLYKKLMLMVAGAVSLSAFGGLIGQPEKVSVDYMDWDAEGRVLTNATATACTVVTADTQILTDGGWYAVTNEVVSASGLALLTGTAHLILCDGATLAVTNTPASSQGEHPYMVMVGPNAHLMIYGQADGSGSLRVIGEANCPGIGVSKDGVDVVEHHVTINGGRVTAIGGEDAAGIGGGYFRGGCAVTINGGVVTATGGGSAAGIGGGSLGKGGQVTINGGTVTATGGETAAGIGGGCLGAGGTTEISGGAIRVKGGAGAAAFGKGFDTIEQLDDGETQITGGIFDIEKIKDKWIAEDYMAIDNRDEATKSDYPKMVVRKVYVTIDELHHQSVAWTSDDGTKTNVLDSCEYFFIPSGTEGVKVIFTPRSGYEFVEGEESGVRVLQSPLTDDVRLTAPAVRPQDCQVSFVIGEGVVSVEFAIGEETETLSENEIRTLPFGSKVEILGVRAQEFRYPYDGPTKFTVSDGLEIAVSLRERMPGCPEHPWAGGDSVDVWTNGTGGLLLGGSGAMSNYVSVAAAPWAAVAGDVKSVTVQDGVTLGRNALACLSDAVPVNGLPIAFQRDVTAASGMSVILPGTIAARPVTVEVVDGAVKIGVSVRKTDDISAKPEDWPKVDLSNVDVQKNGERIILTIPVTAAQGFFQIGTGAE